MPIGRTPESGSQGRRRARAAAASSGRGGEPIFARKAVAAAGENRGAPAILDGRQSPRRHAMAMLISLSHRDEREITVLPPNPFRAFGVNSKTLQMPAARPHSRVGVRQTVQTGGPPWPLPTARSASKRRTPCRSKSVGAWPGATARARDGDGAGGKSAGGPRRETPHPQERACRARGTECVDHDRAAHYLLSGGLAVRTSRLRLSLENSRVKSLKARFFANLTS